MRKQWSVAIQGWLSRPLQGLLQLPNVQPQTISLLGYRRVRPACPPCREGQTHPSGIPDRDMVQSLAVAALHQTCLEASEYQVMHRTILLFIDVVQRIAIPIQQYIHVVPLKVLQQCSPILRANRSTQYKSDQTLDTHFLVPKKRILASRLWANWSPIRYDRKKYGQNRRCASRE